MSREIKKKRLKDWIFRDYTIKIERLREVYKTGDMTEYVDKMFLVDIGSTGGRHTMFGVPIDGNFGEGIKKLAEEIKKHL